MIVHEILHGSLYQRGRTHSLDISEKAATFELLGISHVVAMAPSQPDDDLVVLDREGSLMYTHYPITDGVLKAGIYIDRMAQRLTDEIEAGGCVLTMCNAGRNRSGLLSALIVHHMFGIPGSDAIEVVRAGRPNALANDYFVAFLEGFK